MSTGRRLGYRAQQRERAWWLAAGAALAAGLWALAQVLAWPVATRAALATLAAATAVIVPELRARAGRADLRAELLLQVEVLGDHATLPLVRDVGPAQLRIHAAQLQIPYIRLDAEGKLDKALRDREPVLIVGHSMSGKTRLAAWRVREIHPDATFVAPRSAKALRQLVDKLNMAGTLIWLDDLDRFLSGDDAVDLSLLQRLRADAAILVATIRRSELVLYRPSKDKRPPEWDVLAEFRQVALQRALSDDELERVRAAVTDTHGLAAVKRYGLAVGAGPEAIDRFDDGETTCPVGFGLVRAAVDWRRAGLARSVPLDTLVQALPAYLEDRDDVVPDTDAITEGVSWATDKINETVALLLRRRPPTGTGDDRPEFEAFDYLIDTVDERRVPIPSAMWGIAARATRGTDSAAQFALRWSSFVGRAQTIAELAAWLSSPPAEDDRMIVITGGPGVGKSALLSQLVSLADPAVHRVLSVEDALPAGRLAPDVISLSLSAQRKAAWEIAREIVAASGAARLGEQLMEAEMSGDGRLDPKLVVASLAESPPQTILVDGLDESTGEREVAELLAAIAQASGVPHRVLATTRPSPQILERLGAGRVINLDNDPVSRDSLAALVRHELLRDPRSPYRDSPRAADLIAAEVAAAAQGSPLTARMMAMNLLDLDSPVSRLEEAPMSVDAMLDRGLNRLGERAQSLLIALALAPPSGLSCDAWLASAASTPGPPGPADIDSIVESGRFVTVAAGSGGEPTYRLAHVRIREYLVSRWQERGKQGGVQL